jgi:hypothetical protein
MGQFGAVVGPDTLAPGAVAAGLGGQQLEPRPSVAGVVGRDPGPGSAGGPASWPSMGSAPGRRHRPRTAHRSSCHPLVWRWLSCQPRLVEEVGQPVGAVAGPAAARWGAGPAAGITASSPGWVPLATSCSRYWVRFRIGVWEPEQSRTTRRELGGLVIIPPGSGHRRSGDQRRPPHGRPAASGCGPWPGGGVQLADQLGVAALGLDRGQPVRQGGPLPRPTLRGAPCVLLDQQPLVAAVLQA